MINRLEYSRNIMAKRTEIWETLWNEDSYREWASVFFEGSFVSADNWGEGSKVLFLAPDQSGIYSIIQKHIPNEIIIFKHMGSVVKGEEQAIDDEAKKWSGATEIYKLTEGKDNIKLTIEIDVMDEHLDFMNSKLPLALQKIQNLAENR